ncbi:MAG: hypothetical protein M5U34_00855 [Chloroflexi bacterium]|nr:hypothetical protein [Chloroflexota bacterium]
MGASRCLIASWDQESDTAISQTLFTAGINGRSVHEFSMTPYTFPWPTSPISAKP